jgi:DNA-binding transcriptional MerR regulator
MRAAPEPLAATLVEQGMPLEEVRSILDADDLAIVRRHLELHRKRLAEQLEDQLRAVGRVERLLVLPTDQGRVHARAG